MPEAFLNPHPLLLSLFILFALACLAQLLYFWLLFFRLTLKSPSEKKHPASSIQHPVSSIQHPVSSIQHPVSVVICAHNEYRNLETNLPLILEQDYPDFEVIVVNHASDDDTAFLLEEMANRYPRL